MSDYYWCLNHQRVERGIVCRATNRLGPYATEQEARDWSERLESREDSWKAEDKRWLGDKAPDD